MKEVLLYIKTHNKTGLKYFGKSIVNLTQEKIEKYKGSGTRWLKHLKKHGEDVKTEIYGIYNLENVQNIALKFSEDNNIVESTEWANLIPENGIDGGDTSKYRKKYTHSNETKTRIKEALSEKDTISGLTKTQKAQKSKQKTIYNNFDRSFEFGHKSNNTKKTKISTNGLTVMENQSIKMSENIKNNREEFDERVKRGGNNRSNKHWVEVYNESGELQEKIRLKEFKIKYPSTLGKYFEPFKLYYNTNGGPCKYPQYKGWYIKKIKLV